MGNSNVFKIAEKKRQRKAKFYCPAALLCTSSFRAVGIKEMISSIWVAGVNFNTNRLLYRVNQ
jgi:hypothetical protein